MEKETSEGGWSEIAASMLERRLCSAVHEAMLGKTRSGRPCLSILSQIQQMRQALPFRLRSLSSISRSDWQLPYHRLRIDRTGRLTLSPIVLARLFGHSNSNYRIQRVRPKDVLARSVSSPWSKLSGGKGKMSGVEAQETAGVRVAVEGCVGFDDRRLSGSF